MLKKLKKHQVPHIAFNDIHKKITFGNNKIIYEKSSDYKKAKNDLYPWSKEVLKRSRRIHKRSHRIRKSTRKSSRK
jgi:hypothetical protein